MVFKTFLPPTSFDTEDAENNVLFQESRQRLYRYRSLFRSQGPLLHTIGQCLSQPARLPACKLAGNIHSATTVATA
ncbi:MAG: hypothetical protein GY868_15220 [Deltaproteobacteria bacterium]|nr:hypothetical protein [Deltaproteobacteria bacterium]